MFRSKFSFVFLFTLFLGSLALPVGCDNSPKPCTTRTDCGDATVYVCLRSFCFTSCKTDADCTDGKKCNAQGGCGELPDSGTPIGECSSGETRKCYDAASGCVEDSGQFLCKGICKEGTQKCGDDGKWGTCEGSVTPESKEICGDAKDNNCNGQVDEECGTVICTLGDTKPCYTGATGCTQTGDVYSCKGNCKAGTRSCQSGSDGKPEWSECKDQVLPIGESCANQIDDNCDGTVNEGCACKVGESRKCTASNSCGGIQTCQTKAGGSDWTECVASSPTEETCDGIDNDCDGKIDNVKGSDTKLTRACTKLCFNGMETCTDGKFQNCDAEDPIPNGKGEHEDTDGDGKPDVDTWCNGRDDDCDGRIDNVKGRDAKLRRTCDPSTPGNPVFGPCKENASQECADGSSIGNPVWGTCEGGMPAPAEDCNGVDDDCDGKTDEDAQCPMGETCQKNTLGNKVCAP
ncbi:MAG: hypothetical protein H6728_14160 [Myxococcales bacterium]|nr:hypothetical protein [Myxococcales bacterium]